jgi:hypothetical protein
MRDTRCLVRIFHMSNSCLSLEITLAIAWRTQSFGSNYECLLFKEFVMELGMNRKRLFPNLCCLSLELNKTQAEECILTRLSRSWKQ